MKVRTSGGFIAALIEDLGAENVPMSPTKVREALIDGTIDGVAFPYEAGPAFNIVDQYPFISELQMGTTMLPGFWNVTTGRRKNLAR